MHATRNDKMKYRCYLDLTILVLFVANMYRSIVVFLEKIIYFLAIEEYCF